MDNPHPSPFNNCPGEVCEAILKQLSQQDALNLRLVNKRWKVLVDELYSNWSIKIDKNHLDLERMLKLKIKKVNITGFVLSSFLYRLLHHSKNLKNLSLKLSEWNLIDPYTTEPTSYDLAKLLDLKIQIQSITRICPENNVFTQIMNHSDLSNLRSLEIDINVNYEIDSWTLWRIVFDFLQAAKSKCKNLVSLTVGSCGTRDVVSADADVVGNSYATLQNLVMRYLGVSGSVVENWRKFIKCQNSLKNFEVDRGFIPFRLLSNVVLKNFETLKSIKLHGVELGERMLVDGVNMRYFDLEIFRKCQDLETLDLLMVQRGLYINFNRLPATLHKLSLSYGLIDSDEILDFFERQNKVTSLSLQGAGSSGRFGVNGTILDILLALEALKFVHFGNESINFSVAEEKEKLERIYASTSNYTFTTIVNGNNEVQAFGHFYKGYR